MYRNQRPGNYTRIRLINILLTDEELNIAAQINVVGHMFKIEYYNYIGSVNSSVNQFEKFNQSNQKEMWLSKVEKFVSSNCYSCS